MGFLGPEMPEMGCWEGDEGPDGAESVIAMTTEPVRLAVAEMGGLYHPPGAVSMGTFLEGRLIARSWVEPGVIRMLNDIGFFEERVGLALVAWESGPVLEGRLFAVLDPDSGNPPAEDWRNPANDDQAIMIPLGTHQRRDRAFPQDLGHEAIDLLGALLQGHDAKSDVIDRLLEDLVR